MPPSACDNAAGKIKLGALDILGVPKGQGPSGKGNVYILHFKSLAVGTSSISLASVIVVGAQFDVFSRSLPMVVSGAVVIVGTGPSLTLTPTPAGIGSHSGQTNIDASVAPFIQISEDRAVDFGQLKPGLNTQQRFSSGCERYGSPDRLVSDRF